MNGMQTLRRWTRRLIAISLLIALPASADMVDTLPQGAQTVVDNYFLASQNADGAAVLSLLDGPLLTKRARVLGNPVVASTQLQAHEGWSYSVISRTRIDDGSYAVIYQLTDGTETIKRCLTVAPSYSTAAGYAIIHERVVP